LLNGVLGALEAFQVGNEKFHLFTSKFDAVLEGRATLTVQEARGLALFNNPAAGNCAACHPSAPGPGGAKPLFTNFGYFALGVPRSSALANADSAFFDLGLCGPRRTDLAARSDLCGLFKTPTLRNVALTAPYFHNGIFNTLEEVVDFDATRDTDPARWYPTVGGVVQMFNDLPAIYHSNVTRIAPFSQMPGQPPQLSPQDILDIAAFLRTLTDGWTP
jgi:cytochrome c peroxidase